MHGGSRRCFRFGQFEVDEHARVLRKAGMKVRLQEQPFQVLLALIASAGEIVTREELRKRVWPEGTFVEFDHALNTAVKKIRIALCDDAAVPRYVETIPRRGYRFLMPIEEDNRGGMHSFHKLETLDDVGAWSLRGWRVAGAVALILVTGLIVFELSLAPKPSQSVEVAVLPFSDMDELDQSATGERIARAVREQLQQRHQPGLLLVGPGIETRSDFSGSKGGGSAAEYVVQGGISSDQGGLRMTVQLVRISDNTRIWAGHVKATAGEASNDRQLAERVATMLQPVLAVLSNASR